jgi:hypothetical protein
MTQRTPLRARLLTALSGDPDGTPRWVRDLTEGADEGWFADGGAVWTVHAGMGTLVAGIRALLIQALHPGALAGVHDFSRYREDPISRLNGTVRWVLSVTYGSRAQAERETARVARLHRRVSGEYTGADGTARQYTASSADLVDGCISPSPTRSSPRTRSGAGRFPAEPTRTSPSGRPPGA